MPTKSKTPSSVDEIKSIDEQVKPPMASPEENVISIRIPRKEKVETSSVSETAKDLTKTVSSFSLLDADKSDSASEPDTMKSTENDVTSDAQGEDKPSEADNPLTTESLKVDSESTTSDSTEESPKETPSPKTEDDIKKWLNETDPEETFEEAPKGGKLKAFIIALIVVTILGAVGGGIYYYQTNVSSVDTGNESNVVITPTITPSPTEAPVEDIDLSAFTVEVLNGSGKAGLAGTVATALTDAGFLDATAGNADASNYEETIVSLKESTPKGVYTELDKILGTDYVLELSEEPLDEDSEYDVSIVLGSSKPEEVDATPTPTEEVEN